MRLQQFDLNLLRALDALLRERNVTRAAEQLHVTQQAMSGALRRLRDAFDDPLLVRAGRGLQLTPRAATLVDPVRDVMLRIELAVQTRPIFDPAVCNRRFSVAMSDYAAVTLLPAVMARLSTEAPRMVLDVKLIDRTSSKALETGDIDLCLLPSDWTLFRNYAPRGVCDQELYEDDFVCVVSKSNSAVGDALDTAQYLAMPHTALRLGDGVHSVVEATWKKLGLAPHIAATATSFASMVFMVSDSALIATVQRRLAQQFARMSPIRVLECPIAIDRLKASMSWRLLVDGDPAHQYLRETFARAGMIARRDKPPL